MTALSEGQVRELVEAVEKAEKTYDEASNVPPVDPIAVSMTPEQYATQRSLMRANGRLHASSRALAHTSLSLYAELAALRTQLQQAQARAEALEKVTDRVSERMLEKARALELVDRERALTYRAAEEMLHDEIIALEVAQAAALAGDEGVGRE